MAKYQQKKAILYTRVSSGEQAEHGTSLASQLEACRMKASEMGVQVVREIEDAGVSGALFETRPGIQKALGYLRDGEANMLIVATMSRLSRDHEHQAVIKKSVEAIDAKLIFCDSTYDDTATGDLAFQITGSFAVYERQVIRERTMKGRRKRAEEGQQPCRRFSPFGYHVVSKADVLRGEYRAELLGTYQIVNEQGQFVRDLFRQYGNGKSLREVCRWLQDTGVPTPRDGTYWRPETIKRMLENPVYKGKPVYGRHKKKFDEGRIARGFVQPFQTVRTEPETWVQLECQPLVDEMTWDTCNRRLKEANKLFSGNPKNKYALTGLLRCPKCDRGMRAQRWENKTPDANGSRAAHSYFCPNAFASRNSAGHVCTYHKHHGKTMDGLAVKAICEAAQRPEAFTAALIAYQQAQNTGITHNQITQLKSRVRKLELEEQNTIKAQIAGINAGASPDAYKKEFEDIGRQRVSIEKQLEEAEKQLSPVRKSKTNTPAFGEILAAVEDALNAPEISSAERHNLIATVVERIVPHAKGVCVYLKSLTVGDTTVANVPLFA